MMKYDGLLRRGKPARKGRGTMKFFSPGVVAVWLGMLLSGGALGDISVWDLPAGKSAESAGREGWKPADKASRFEGGMAVENERLTVIIARGASGPVIRAKAADACVEVAIIGDGGSTGRVNQVRLKDSDMTDVVIGITSGALEADLIVRAGMNHVEVRPGKDARKLEVRATARYALAPSFTAEDRLYDATQHKSAVVPVPARPLILELLDGRQAILALLWKDSTSAAKDKDKDKDKKEEKTLSEEGEMRKVELVLAGDGVSRAFRAARIDFLGRPVHVGMLQGTNVWQAVDVRKLPGGKTQRIEWKRPYEAAWRVDFVVTGYDKQEVAAFLKQAADLGLSKGNENDWRNAYLTIDEPKADTDPLRIESMYFRPAGKDGKLPAMNPTAPGGDDRVWPCVFKGEDSLLSPPAEWPAYPDPTRERLDAVQEQRAKEGKEPLYPIHAYDKAVMYPLDRIEKTPIDKFAVVDLMRQALGTGPCKLDWLENCR